MLSTVNRRCIVHILAKRERLQTVSLKLLLILFNKRHNILNNTKNLRWYRNWWSLCIHMTSLTCCCCPRFCGCIFERNKSKKQDKVPCETFWQLDTTNCNLSKIGIKYFAIPFCETWNYILKACIALKPEGGDIWKPHNCHR